MISRYDRKTAKLFRILVPGAHFFRSRGATFLADFSSSESSLFPRTRSASSLMYDLLPNPFCSNLHIATPTARLQSSTSILCLQVATPAARPENDRSRRPYACSAPPDLHASTSPHLRRASRARCLYASNSLRLHRASRPPYRYACGASP